MLEEYKTKNVCSTNTKKKCVRRIQNEECVPRIQKEYVLEEYKKRMCVRRIQNEECVLEEYKTKNVC